MIELERASIHYLLIWKHMLLSWTVRMLCVRLSRTKTNETTKSNCAFLLLSVVPWLLADGWRIIIGEGLHIWKFRSQMRTHRFSTNWYYCVLYFLQPYQLHIACLLFYCSYILGLIQHQSLDVFPLVLLRKMFTISLVLVGRLNTLTFAGASISETILQYN